ncbi:hypothetical protein H9X87_10775 [Pseudoflavonifractor capillosus]|uniref:hypothetical protein n=1 Tax=Pseudoflavonifractor capillosus TaxID=106588 RepID=UPI0019589855|nr:hypothetical protein [Pseudoflavonifractor capillosus]MBM6695237.1 hypothetical protein [Pseudoflavonifractor capillosus]
MRCGTSFYNGTLGKQLTLRFWPLIALYSVIWAIVLPISGLNYMRSGSIGGWVTDIEYLFRALATPMTIVFGVLAAMAVCSHLYTTRSCNFTAALPPKRTALFATHYLTGLLWLVVPVAVMTLMASFLAIGCSLSGFASGLALVCMQTLFFYSFAVLCGMLTGHLLALPVFYGIFNGLVGGIWTLLTAIFQEFYYGYPGSVTIVPAWVAWCTPVWNIFFQHATTDGFDPLVVAVYAGVGVLMALGSWLLYLKRPMERAGDVVIWAGLRPVFRYGVALCSGLALGSLTRLVLGLDELGLAVSVMLWGVAGCFVGQMFLSKSVRVLRYWKGAGAIACACAALFLVMKLDLTGYETQVPEADEVVSVTISGLDSYPVDTASNFHDIQTQDPQAISLITQLHQALVDQRNTFNGYYDNSTRFDVTYTLADGTRLTRSYTVYVNEVDLDRAGTVTQLAHQLVNDSKLMLLSYEFHELEANGYRPTGGTFYLTSDTGNTSTGHDLSTSEAQSLYQAIVQDIQEGNLPRTLFYGYGDVHIDLYWSISPNSFNQLADPYNTDHIPGNYISVEITNQAVHTLEVLEELGN